MNPRVILTCIALVATAMTQPAVAGDDREGARGISYLTTITDSNGNFARGVITLHSDHTMSVTDSGQGGPTFLFSSQLGSWQLDDKGVVIAKTIAFAFPKAGVARLDYTIHVGKNGSATGTIKATDFPLLGDPFGSGGADVGTFTFTAQSIAP